MRHGTAAVLGALIVILVPLSIYGQKSAPAVPPELKPPDGAKLVLQAFAQGDQIYTCKEQTGSTRGRSRRRRRSYQTRTASRWVATSPAHPGS